jgi:hypothetical protein
MNNGVKELDNEDGKEEIKNLQKRLSEVVL